MAKNFKICVSLTKQHNNELVYYKQDGERFSKSQTVKLNVNTAYWVKLSVRPSMALHGLIVQGERTEFEPDIPTKSIEDDATYLKASYTTDNCDTHTRGMRKELALVFEFEHGLTMKTAIQIKLYKTLEKEHSSWGQALTVIEYDCMVPDGHTYVDIVREKYL